MFSPFRPESNTTSLHSQPATRRSETGSYSNGNLQSASGLEYGVIRGSIPPTMHLLPHVFFDASPTGDGYRPMHDHRAQGDPFQFCAPSTIEADMWSSMQFPQPAIDCPMESVPQIQVNPPALVDQRDIQERTVVSPTAQLLIGSRDSPRAKPCRVRERGRHAPRDGPLGFCMWGGGCRHFIKEGSNGALLKHLMRCHGEVGLTGTKRLHCRWEGCKGIRHSNDHQVSAANLRRHISSDGHVTIFI